MAKMVEKKEVVIEEVRVELLDAYLLGRTPIILKRMTEKGCRELLLPKGPKTRAEKASTLKHNVYEEFRSAPYILADGEPTLLGGLSVWAKKGLAAVASDLPGGSRAQLERLVQAQGERIPIWGIPKLHMSMVRMAGFSKTPDVRTRVIITEWCTKVTLRYVAGVLTSATVGNLLGAAGIMQGMGEWRPQKGGIYGQYEIVEKNDPRYLKLVKECGRAAQEKAMKAAEPYDEDTAELLSWYRDELGRRGKTKDLEAVA